MIPSEWSLSTEPFHWVIKWSPLGPSQVDMFANSLNFKLKDYISPCPDPQALAVDALNCQWPVRVAICVATGVHNTRVSATVEGGAAIQGPISGAVESSSEVAGIAEQLPEEISVSSPGLEEHAATTTLEPQPSKSGVS